MTVYLLRHVHAGDRHTWEGTDRLRPVSERGIQQAAALVDQFAPYDLDRVITSPYRRCVQSVEPLAQARGLEVEHDDRLAEGTPLDVVRRLLREAAGAGEVVLCSHGDVVGAVVTDLHHRGTDLGVVGPRWQKASTWVLDGDLERPVADYLPPPG